MSNNNPLGGGASGPVHALFMQELATDKKFTSHILGAASGYVGKWGGETCGWVWKGRVVGSMKGCSTDEWVEYRVRDSRLRGNDGWGIATTDGHSWTRMDADASGWADATERVPPGAAARRAGRPPHVKSCVFLL